MNIRKYLPTLFLSILVSCGNNQQNPDGQQFNSAESPNTVARSENPEKPDTRIKQIKQWYGEIQQAGKIGKCSIKTSTTMDGFDEKFPFTNTFESCLLKNDFSYKVATLNGYEWGEICTWYYENGNLFFVFDRTGSEGCFSEARVYYDAAGKIIQIMESVNDCDGQDVGEAKIVEDPTKQKEILDRIAQAKSNLEKAMSSEEK